MSSDDRRSRSGRLGTALLATVLGVGVGLMAAPQTGAETRRALRKRLDAAREGLEEEMEELEERSRPMRRVVRARAEELGRRGRKRYEEALEALEDEADELEDGDEGSSTLSTALIIGAGIAAATYFFTSDRTATARERVFEAAATVRDEAEARWEQFQESRRTNGQPFADRGTRTDTAGSAPTSN